MRRSRAGGSNRGPTVAASCSQRSANPATPTVSMNDGSYRLDSHDTAHLSSTKRALIRESRNQTTQDPLAVGLSADAGEGPIHLLNVSVGWIQNWEQGCRSPRVAARTHLQVAKQHPEVLERITS